MTSWTQLQPASFLGRTSRKVCLLRELWKSLSTLQPKPTRYKKHTLNSILKYVFIDLEDNTHVCLVKFNKIEKYVKSSSIIISRIYRALLLVVE